MTLVTFADLTHTGKVIDANQFPLAIGFVSALAKSKLKENIDVRLFKFPSEFAAFLEHNEPKISCFSNYMWHENLHGAFAARIKKRYPDVITVFGGPNFPMSCGEQKSFLETHPEIDFYIEGEGEIPFLELFNALSVRGFDVKALKKDRIYVPNVRYVLDDEFVQHELSPRIENIEGSVPSPYLMGLLDGFFTNKLTPMMETSRGCPYSCTYCHSGSPYENKVRRFRQERIAAELDYISARVKVPSLVITDLNWGSFKDDLITAQRLAELRSETGWPRYVAISTAKTQSDRMIAISSLLGDAVVIGASVQSTDPDVLRNVKRSNIAIDECIRMAREASKNGSITYTEVILCLPGDTHAKHINSVLTMMDSGTDDASIYQFILLPGTEAANSESRSEYRYQTRFRVMPRCFGTYSLFGETFSVFEIHEVCVGNSTMSYEDYKQCRSFSLTISIFNNGNVFEEIFGLAKAIGIRKSSVLKKIHEAALNKLADIYVRFQEDEERNFFASRLEIEEFLSTGDAVDAYTNGEYGSNQIYAYRAIAFTERIEHMAEIAIGAMRDEIVVMGKYDELIELYLNELREFIVLRKATPFDLESVTPFWSHFDFETIEKRRFAVTPKDHQIEKRKFNVCHMKDKIADLKAYVAQYGDNLEGLTYFMHRHPARMLYRLAIPDEQVGTF